MQLSNAFVSVTVHEKLEIFTFHRAAAKDAYIMLDRPQVYKNVNFFYYGMAI